MPTKKKSRRGHVPGLYERKLPSGSKRWVLDMRAKGERFVVHLGELSPSVAREKAQIVRGDVLAGRADRWLPNVTEGGLTLREYAEKWLTTFEPELGAVNFRRYKHDLERHVLPSKLGKKKLADIKPGDVTAFLREKRAEVRTVKDKESGEEKEVERYAPNTVRLMRAALSVVLSDAVAEGLIDRNPALYQGGRRPAGVMSKSERREKIRPMDASERGRFLAEARGKHHGVLFELLLKTGLRPSESYGLQVSDIDWKKRTLRIERSVELNTREINTTKTHETRAVDLSPDLAELLRAHVAKLRKGSFKKGKDAGWLFPSEAAGLLDHNNVARTFRRRLKDAELPGFRVYDLRHTFASMLLAKGAPITYVANQLGHANSTTTLSHYAKWIPSEDRGYAALLDEKPGSDFHHPSHHASDDPVSGTPDRT